MASKSTSCLTSSTVDTVVVTTFKKRKEPKNHYVYEITVTWSDDRRFTIHRSYSEFHSFHGMLIKFYSTKGKGSIAPEEFPSLPGRTLFTSAKVTEARLDVINRYCRDLIAMHKVVAQSSQVLSFFTALPGDIKLPKHKWKNQASLHPLGRPTGSSWEAYEVTKPFEAEKDSKQLSLSVGETIHIMRKDDSGWWMGTNGKTAGWVPPSFLRLAPLMPSSDEDDDDGDSIGLSICSGKVIETEEYRAIDDFEAEEESQVSFSEGDILTVVDKEEDGWWFVCVNGKEGWAPFSYLELEKKDRREGNSEEREQSSPTSEDDHIFIASEHENGLNTDSLPDYVTTREYTAVESDELSISSDERVQVVKTSNSGWWTVRYGGKLGLFPASCLIEADKSQQNRRVNLHGQRAVVPRKKTIINRRTIKHSKAQLSNEKLPTSPNPSTQGGQGKSPTSPNPSTQGGQGKRIMRFISEDLPGRQNRADRSRSPGRPCRPRQTLINNALSPSTQSPAISPCVSPRKNSPIAREDACISFGPIQSISESPTISFSPESSPPRLQNGETTAATDLTTDRLVDALLKVILTSDSAMEMKSKLLTDLLVDHPSLASRMKNVLKQ